MTPNRSLPGQRTVADGLRTLAGMLEEQTHKLEVRSRILRWCWRAARIANLVSAVAFLVNVFQFKFGFVFWLTLAIYCASNIVTCSLFTYKRRALELYAQLIPQGYETARQARAIADELETDKLRKE